jgi:DNA mismatch repair ATPase MutS
LLQHVQDQFTADNSAAATQMRRLSRRVALADLRASLFFIVLQLATLWSIHVLWLSERWQHTAGPSARRWLQALGDWEALAALATLHHDHPHWTFPTSTAAQPVQVRAHDLGHPLLPPAACVGNDVEIGPPSTFLLVTGSNMSGKSTLLRAIGLNVLLAQAGGPVCAQSMILPPLALATSMRVQDSLEAGVSYFMAEIQRLKAVVDQAQAAQSDNERTVLFLLDEILHGTNTGERQIAARQIIRHLLQLNTIGAVSTHDLTLADDAALAAASQAVHFTETFTHGPAGPTMRFDYRLRPGIATSTNALKLMELIGLPVEPQDVDTPAMASAAEPHV